MTHPTDALRLVPVPYVVLSEAAGLLDCEGYGPLALTLNNLLAAAPASPLPEGGGDWIDGTPEVPVGSPTWCGWASYEIRRLRSALPAASTGDARNGKREGQ